MSVARRAGNVKLYWRKLGHFFILTYIIMAFIKRAKRYAKKAKRVVYKTVKARYVHKGGANINQIAKDVMMLKHLVNVEKKRFDLGITSNVGVGQLSGAGVSGQFSTVITPFPVEGITGNTRIGNSIKLVSGCLDMQFSQQSVAVNEVKLRWVIVCKPDNNANPSASTSIAQFYDPNPFSGVNDYHSSRDPEYFTSMRIIKSGVVTLRQDGVTSGQSIKQIKVPLKFNHHLKFNTDGSTITTKNQFYLFVTASAGDIAAFTGALLLYNMRWYYTDN